MRRKRATQSPQTSLATPSALPQREHVQALYDRVIGWYEDAERKAQLILTLDGVFLSFVSAAAFRKPADLRATTSQFGPLTWLLLGLMAACLLLSIISAVVALRSRLYSKSELQRELAAGGANASGKSTYGPGVTWFFQDLARLDPMILARTLGDASAEFAIQALALQLKPLSKRVVSKHRWVNRGFMFAAGVLVFFLAAAVSYVSRTAST
jgi:hypothetical protein